MKVSRQKKYLSARLGLESKPMQNKVDRITDLYLLHHLLDDLYRTEKKGLRSWRMRVL
ncbi:hypothetical protein [Anoxybacillus sp. FSL W8-1294]|uniref:hypothetical protein n=1 Tax=Anoxybacillus sp. FSL W8-1294 TaxID=2954655 RepID=UPI0030CC488F